MFCNRLASFCNRLPVKKTNSPNAVNRLKVNVDGGTCMSLLYTYTLNSNHFTGPYMYRSMDVHGCHLEQSGDINLLGDAFQWEFPARWTNLSGHVFNMATPCHTTESVGNVSYLSSAHLGHNVVGSCSQFLRLNSFKDKISVDK